MKQLPVPPLAQSLDRYLTALQPLVTAEELAISAQFAADFAAGEGAECQAALEQFAAAENQAGRNFMSEAWYAGYLGSRGPLPLVSNVSFQLVFESKFSGLARAADVIYQLAWMQLKQLRGEGEPDISPRGEELSPSQWRFATGAMREPRAGCDAIVDGPTSPQHREILVLRHNNAYAVRVADEQGQPLPRPVLEQTLQAIVAADHAPGRFTDLSYLGSASAADILAELLADEANQQVYQRLREALFLVDLAEGCDDPILAMRRLTFESGHAWTYKPATYQIDVGGDFVAVHFEHTLADGATLKELVARAQRHEPNETPGSAPEPELLQWSESPDLAARIDAGLSAFEAEAAKYRVRRETCDFRVPAGFKLSTDAAMQWVMLYAQVATWGRVRSHYEAVDMREYAAGRTECLRSVTPEAVALVRGLLAGDATAEQLEATRVAHSGWVKACKSGNAIDRHLFGLQLMASRLGLTPAIFADESYKRLTQDLLSTTSLGDRAQIIRVTFAPTARGCIGAYYSADAASFEFCLIWRTDERPEIDVFAANLAAGTAALQQLVDSVAG